MNVSMTGLILALMLIFCPPILLLTGIYMLQRGISSRDKGKTVFGVLMLMASAFGFWLFMAKPWKN